MEYYGGLLLLLFLLLHISIKLFFSSLFFSSFSLSLSHSFSFTPSVCAAFFARPDSCCCGWRRAQKMLMCSCKKGRSGGKGERERSRKIFSISFIWIFWYWFFMSPVYVFSEFFYSTSTYFVNWVFAVASFLCRSLARCCCCCLPTVSAGGIFHSPHAHVTKHFFELS